MTEFARTAAVSESITLAVADRVRALEKAGRLIVKLQTGDPDFATPAAVVEAAGRAMREGHTHYANTRGLPELRECISAKLARDSGVSYDPQSEILVTHGGAHAIFCALLTLVSPGDEVILPDPSWMPYGAATQMAGGRPVRVALDPDSGFLPDVDRIRAAITPRTRVIVVNTPANPTGRVWTAAMLKTLESALDGSRIWVLADEVYERLVYDGSKHISPASIAGLRDRTVTVNSFSKTYAMTGWRLGYLAAPPSVASEVLKCSQYSITNVAPFVQRAGVVAMTDVSVSRDVDGMVAKYVSRRSRILERLSGQDAVGFTSPDGAFYVMLDFRRLAQRATELVAQLLDDASVALVPGSGFGECASGFARMTFAAADADIDEGLGRIIEFAQRHAGAGRS